MQCHPEMKSTCAENQWCEPEWPLGATQISHIRVSPGSSNAPIIAEVLNLAKFNVLMFHTFLVVFEYRENTERWDLGCQEEIHE